MKKNTILTITIIIFFLIFVNMVDAIWSDTWEFTYKHQDNPVYEPQADFTVYNTLSFGGKLDVQGNVAPTITNEVPLNESTGISLQPICNVTVTDDDGNPMNVTFATNETGVWVNMQANNSVVNGSYQWKFTDADTAGTKYWWKVYCDDGTNNVSETYYFTTLDSNLSVTVTNPYPANQSTDISINLYEWNVTIEEPEGHAFFWNITAVNSSSGTWVGTNESVADTNGSKIINVSGNLSYNTLYYVYVNATDTNTWTNKTFTFTTEVWSEEVFTLYSTLSFGGKLDVQSGEPILSDEYPTNGSTSIIATTMLNITISDLQSDNMNVSWYTNASGSWLPFAYNSTCADGTYRQVATWAIGSEAKYWWSVAVNDTSNHWANETYWFITQDANPVIVPDPANESTGVDMYPLLNLTVTSPAALTMNVSWSTNASGTWIYYNSTVVSGSTVSQRALFANASNTKYWWTVCVNDTVNNWANETYWFQTATYAWGNWSEWWTFNYTCEVPDNFTATAYNKTDINLSWDNTIDGNDANVIVRNASGWASATYPITPTNGTTIYNGTLHMWNDTMLKQSTTYYYTLWSWNDTEHSYSIINRTASATTDGDIEIYTSSVYPPNESTEIERPATNFSIIINGTNLDVYFYYYNCTPITNVTSLFASWTGQNTQRFSFTPATLPNTDWIWGNTGYIWYVNVTDGNTWVNQSFRYTSLATVDGKDARFDVYTPLGLVSGTDAQRVWNSVNVGLDFNRIFDVWVPYNFISGTDAQRIWYVVNN